MELRDLPGTWGQGKGVWRDGGMYAERGYLVPLSLKRQQAIELVRPCSWAIQLPRALSKLLKLTSLDHVAPNRQPRTLIQLVPSS